MRQPNEKMQLTVGAFVAIGLVATIMVIFIIGSQKHLFEKHYNLTCQFDDISGIRNGATVHLAGVQIGVVDKTEMDDSLQTKKIKLVLKLNPKFKKMIREDSQASIVTQGLLGDKSIAISVGSNDSPELKEGQEIGIKESSDISALVNKGANLLDTINITAENLSNILEDVKNEDSLLHSLLYDKELATVLTDLKTSTQNVNRFMNQITQIAAKINQGQGTLGALVNDGTLYNDVKTLLGKANRNKLIRAVVRYTLQTKEEKTIKK